jgi:DNase/tRNase domain of colicin-like bacteriocin
VLNPELLARELAQVALKDPKAAGALLAEMKGTLSAADQQKLTQELAEEIDGKLTAQVNQQAQAHADDIAKQKADLALDLVQIGLSVAGIFDPTPISDGADGLISLFRGDLLGAGISVVSMIPYIGDAAKLGKLGKFAETISKAVDLAKADAAFAAAIKPALDKIGEALKAVPMDSLPQPAREALQTMQRKIDEFNAPAAARVADDVLPGGVRVTPDAKGLINGVHNAGPNAPRFDKWVADGGTVRYDSATNTYAYSKSIETATQGTRQVEIAYRPGADGIARPDFSAFTRDTVQIPTTLPKSYPEHFKAANEALGDKLRADPGLEQRLGLNSEQVELITKQPPSAKSPPGLTWHHGENGAMHLVDKNVHGTFTHQGGMASW